MRLLIDTNVIIEVMLNQQQAQQAKDFLALAGQHSFYLSNFSLHSICQILLRRRLLLALETFFNDVILTGNITVVAFKETELPDVIDAARLLNLDFDDAYQYTMAEKNNLTLVSFDRDFDKTPRGRQTPQAINQLNP